MSLRASSVRVSSEGLIEDMIAGNYSVTMNVQAQLEQVLQMQRELQVSINATDSKTHLLQFLLGQMSASNQTPISFNTYPSD